MDNLKLWVVFTVGVAAGATVALMYAPDAGPETRRKLKQSFDEATDYVKDTTSQLGDQAQDLINRGKSAVTDQASDLLNRGKSAVSSAADAVKSAGENTAAGASKISTHA